MDCYFFVPHLGLRWFDENLYTSLSCSCESEIVRWESYMPPFFCTLPLTSFYDNERFRKSWVTNFPRDLTFHDNLPEPHLIICSYISTSKLIVIYLVEDAVKVPDWNSNIYLPIILIYGIFSKNNKVIMKTNYILLVLVLCMPTCLRHICQFWDTITLFKPVKGASKGA